MNQEERRKRDKVKIVLINFFMLISILAILAVLLMITMGFTITKNLDLARTGLVQISSSPSGATVSIDDGAERLKTTARSSLLPGRHTVTVHKAGYTTWRKSIMVKSGGVLWLDYVQLFPLENVVTDALKVKDSDVFAFSPNNKRLVVLPMDELGTINIHDIGGDTIKTKQASYVNVLTIFEGDSTLEIGPWSSDGSKLLVKRHLGDQVEWLLLDIEHLEKSININSSLQIAFDEVIFGAENGEVIFGAKDGILNKIDTNTLIISQIAKNVNTFTSHNNRLAFVSGGDEAEEEPTMAVWTYRNGDQKPIKFRDVNGENIQLAIGNYRSDDYLAIFEDGVLYAFSGQFQSTDDGKNSLSLIRTATFEQEEPAKLSVKHRFFVLKSGGRMLNYDIETEAVTNFNLEEADGGELFWLNEYLFCVDGGSRLVAYDFDGGNRHEVIAAKNAPAVITPDHKYLYFFDANETGETSLKRLNLLAK